MTLLVLEGWLLCCCAYETIKVEEGRIVEIKTKLQLVSKKNAVGGIVPQQAQNN